MSDEQQVSRAAGRELDALIAEKVMGWSDLAWNDSFTRVHGREPGKLRGTDGRRVVPLYSTEISAAWEVLERAGPSGWGRGVEHVVTEGHTVFWQAYIGVAFGRGDTAPHAICLAALEAVAASLGEPPAAENTNA